MSRHVFENTKFSLVIGVDHVTGPFLQVWAGPSEEKDQPAIWIDNQGVQVYEDVTECRALNAQMVEKFQDERNHGNKFPNMAEEHVIAYGKKLGFTGSEFERKVYEIFD
jgi:hypothetical protein